MKVDPKTLAEFLFFTILIFFYTVYTVCTMLCICTALWGLEGIIVFGHFSIFNLFYFYIKKHKAPFKELLVGSAIVIRPLQKEGIQREGGRCCRVVRLKKYSSFVKNVTSVVDLNTLLLHQDPCPDICPKPFFTQLHYQFRKNCEIFFLQQSIL